MTLWLWMAFALMLGFIPCGIVTFRGAPEDRLVGLEMTGVLLVLELVLLTEGYHRPPFFDLPLTVTLLAFGSGLVFIRFLERWV